MHTGTALGRNRTLDDIERLTLLQYSIHERPTPNGKQLLCDTLASFGRIFAHSLVYIRVRAHTGKEELLDAAEQLRHICSIKTADQIPPEKYDLPQTSSQEYGWVHKPLVEVEDEFMAHNSRSSCEITRYADAYYTMAGTTPFSKRET